MLLSKIPGNRTVGFRQSKKGKHSTRSRLRVDPGFVEFPQTPRGRIFSILEFYSHLNVLTMFRLNEAVRGHLIGPKTWDRIDKIFERKLKQFVTAPRLFRGCLGVVWFNLCIKWLFGMHWAGNGRGLRVH